MINPASLPMIKFYLEYSTFDMQKVPISCLEFHKSKEDALKMYDIEELLDGLRQAPKILSEFVKTIPETKLNLKRGDGFWTIAEHLSHLAQVQPMLLERINRFLSEDQPEFIPYFPDKEESGTGTVAVVSLNLSEAVAQFKKYRNKQILLLETAAEGIWKRIGEHPEYDQYSLYILTRHILMHDYWHMYRMEELWLAKDAYLTKME